MISAASALSARSAALVGAAAPLPGFDAASSAACPPVPIVVLMRATRASLAVAAGECAGGCDSRPR
jgi:hypothetical protein